MRLDDFYHGKRVLVTGHTGFKGSWLCVMLHLLGAHVSGYSLGIPTEVSMFEQLNISAYLDNDFRGDILNEQALQSAIETAHPDIVIHLAAQPIVLKSYREPLETLQTNIIGTACVLNCIRANDFIRAAIIITTDKCYQNQNWIWGYRENDPLGGDDPYSCSKACAELVTSCFVKSYFQECACCVSTARAGNVIGGGDWAENRLIPDIIRAAAAKEQITLRHPNSIRPWQHVTEPLNGYLQLCQKMYETPQEFAGAWNFGPSAAQCANVREITEKLSKAFGCNIAYAVQTTNSPTESELLTLDSTKAIQKLGWRPVLTLDEALMLTQEWYQCYLSGADLLEKTKQQLLYVFEKLPTQEQQYV